VLDEVVLKLSDVINWKVGTQILLNAEPNAPVELRCGEVSMFHGIVGRKRDSIAVEVSRTAVSRRYLEPCLIFWRC
jgi:flagellar motor switch protein FliM